MSASRKGSLICALVVFSDFSEGFVFTFRLEAALSKSTNSFVTLLMIAKSVGL